MDKDLLWTLVLLPIVVTVFKSELLQIWTDFTIYKNRPYDIDRDPDSPDICLTMNPSTGSWGLCIIHRYLFWTKKKAERGVYFSTLNNGKLVPQHESFSVWDKMKKGEVEKNIDDVSMSVLEKHKLTHLLPEK